MTLEEICTTYNDIVAKELKGVQGRILKTDTYNEICHNYKELPLLYQYDTTYIEIDNKRVGLAHKQHPELNIIQGDIRDLPFPDNYFSAIVDMSTIDHIHPDDTPKVIAEYNRVLNGKLIMVAWCMNHLPEPKPWSPSEQYYLSNEVMGIILNTFTTTAFRPFHHQDGAYLVQICGITKEAICGIT